MRFILHIFERYATLVGLVFLVLLILLVLRISVLLEMTDLATRDVEQANARLAAVHSEREASLRTAADKKATAVPFGQHVHAITRDIAYHARLHGVELRTLEVRYPSGPAVAVSETQLNMVAQAPYIGFKAWLGELIDRYPGLAVRQLELQRAEGGVGQGGVEIRLSLTAYEAAQ